ncbi:MAG: MSHA biogenesis protein MshP [Pseudomonadota bacterium]
MSLFALVLSRNTIQTSNSTTLEMISTQAFYAAESGGQRGMKRLFFPSANVRQQVDMRCNDLITTPIIMSFSSGTNDVPGLNGCNVVVTCGCSYAGNNVCAPAVAANYSTTSAATSSFYKISSVATCGNGSLQAVRTIEVGSFLEQE